MLPTSAGVEPATSWSPVGRASNWATEAGETQLVMLVEDMSRNAIQGRQTDLILLDFSKAFDKVSHEKLLYKLHQYGVRGHVLHWNKAFLSNRTQTVVLENEKSSQVAVTSGVPQGSVLGPILFLVFINDLPDGIRSKVRLFADDTAVYLAVSNLEDAKQLQEDLDRLGDWSLKWDMEFNPSKCTVRGFSARLVANGCFSPNLISSPWRRNEDYNISFCKQWKFRCHCSYEQWHLNLHCLQRGPSCP